MSLDFYEIADLEDGFGATKGRKRPHRGLDIPRAGGTPVPAWAAGTVVISQWHDGLGWVVETDSGGVFPGYCHLKQQGVKVGTRIAVGDTIGYVGTTGSESEGNHLHTTAGNRRGAVFGEAMSYLTDPWPLIQAAMKNEFTTGSGSGGSKKVTAYRYADTKARKEGRTLAPGGSFYLHTDPNAGTSNARNVVGGVGNYSITEHLYAEGTPGDVLRLVLRHQTNPGQSNETNSDHYQHDFVFDANGQIRGEAHAQPYVGSSAGSVAVYALLTALKSNKGTAKITVFDSVAYLHA